MFLFVLFGYFFSYNAKIDEINLISKFILIFFIVDLFAGASVRSILTNIEQKKESIPRCYEAKKGTTVVIPFFLGS